ncbi:hypothetical protein D3C73_1224950 [compost metagenome]
MQHVHQQELAVVAERGRHRAGGQGDHAGQRGNAVDVGDVQRQPDETGVDVLFRAQHLDGHADVGHQDVPQGHEQQLRQRPQGADAGELAVQARSEQWNDHAQQQAQQELAEREAVGHQQPEHHHHHAQRGRGQQAADRGTLGGHGWRISGVVARNCCT